MNVKVVAFQVPKGLPLKCLETVIAWRGQLEAEGKLLLCYFVDGGLLAYSEKHGCSPDQITCRNEDAALEIIECFPNVERWTGTIPAHLGESLKSVYRVRVEEEPRKPVPANEQN